ncbi:hypothetical protein BT96DRAFT_187312 [Gymnopus androsaceus JB14]|uniref:Uncharacterized protein n=1 Tax=Gymnopus androsaceus JB14 TaxID=1447944 RepID=A0A6A4H9T3_9AGAR|nr:hypothetical protein BT96DRAFT_187312 [Gymnopus androsaceus JB14]
MISVDATPLLQTSNSKILVFESMITFITASKEIVRNGMVELLFWVVNRASAEPSIFSGTSWSLVRLIQDQQLVVLHLPQSRACPTILFYNGEARWPSIRFQSQSNTAWAT